MDESTLDTSVFESASSASNPGFVADVDEMELGAVGGAPAHDSDDEEVVVFEKSRFKIKQFFEKQTTSF